MLLFSAALAGSSVAPAPAVAVDPACELTEVVNATLSDADLLAELDGMLASCDTISYGLDGMFDTFQTLQRLLEGDVGGEANPAIAPSDAAQRALRVGQVAHRVRETPLVGVMVGLALELDAIAALERVEDDLSLQQRGEVRAVARTLASGPSLDFTGEREAMQALPVTELPWHLQLFHGSCVEGHGRTLDAIQPLVAAHDRDGLRARVEVRPNDAWTPWGLASAQCSFGISQVALDWIDDRERADAGWVALASR